jgi:hypothetical protein
MKKFILLSMIGMLLAAPATFATEIKSCPSSPAGVWVKFLLNFHRPKMECKSGFGLCLIVTAGIEAPGQSAENSLCLVRGQLNERNQLIIQVEESALSKYEGGSALPYFKEKTSISIPDPYVLSDGTCRALGSSPPLMIKPGNYPVSYENGVFEVVFQL